MPAEWWQDERFWRDVGPFLLAGPVMDAAEEEVDDLLEELEPPEGGRVLDVGCGVGRLLIPLARRGYAVTGVDTCERFRQEVRRRAAAAGLEADVRARSVFDLQLAEGERFDAAMAVFAVIGYPADPIGDIYAVRAMRDALAPGGTLLVRARSPSATRGTVVHRSPGGLCVEHRSWDRATQTLSTRWVITAAGGGQRVYGTQVRVYGADDLRGLLEVCELTEVRAWDSPSEEHVTAVGRRPAT